MKQQIEELEETLHSKTDLILELSAFMNEQATKIVALESKEISSSEHIAEQEIQPNNDKIIELEMILSSKEESIA